MRTLIPEVLEKKELSFSQSFEGLDLRLLLLGVLAPIAYGCDHLKEAPLGAKSERLPKPEYGAAPSATKMAPVSADGKGVVTSAMIAEARLLENLSRPKKIIGQSAFPSKAPRPPITVDLSPKDATAKVRTRTKFIVLHTTESKADSHNYIKRTGVAHFLIKKSGEIVQFISSKKIATHSGLSAFDGEPLPSERKDNKPTLDHCAIGIEVEGSYKTALTKEQIASLRSLVNFMQVQYNVPDQNVISHSQVAFSQNKYVKVPSRGRKWCGVQFTDPDFRKQLGLTARYGYDPEVANNWMDIANADMYRTIYPNDTLGIQVSELLKRRHYLVLPPGGSAYSIAGVDYDNPQTRYQLPNGTTLKGNEVIPNLGSFGRIPPYTKITPAPPAGVKGKA